MSTAFLSICVGAYPEPKGLVIKHIAKSVNRNIQLNEEHQIFSNRGKNWLSLLLPLHVPEYRCIIQQLVLILQAVSSPKTNAFQALVCKVGAAPLCVYLGTKCLYRRKETAVLESPAPFAVVVLRKVRDHGSQTLSVLGNCRLVLQRGSLSMSFHR